MKIAKWLMLDQPIRRSWYAIVVPACVDVPLARSLLHDPWPTWANVMFFLTLMTYGTSRRFFDARLPRFWAIPYSAFALSPLFVLILNHRRHALLLTLGAIALQIPVMLWPSRTGVSVDV